MIFPKFAISPLLALVALAGTELRADNMASIAINPATGEVTLAPQWSIGGGLSGFHLMSQDLSLGGGANQFYSIKGTSIPSGGDTTAFIHYIAASGAATNHADIGSKLTPNSYSALTSADPDVGYGSVNFYFIHHKDSGDYFTVLKPSSGVASEVTDLKPMSGPGGPATLGASGYFGLTFSAANLGYGLNHFYYLRTDAVSGHTRFGTLDPALLGTSADKFDLGTGGFNALAFTGTDVGFGTDKMYYLRLDPITGFTILGTLHPVTGDVSDIANLGSVFSALTFVPGDVGFGVSRFYTAGAVNPTWQSVSFAAIEDRAISSGSFTVAPSASSALAIALTVVPGSTGAASISGPVGGVFTITPTSPGVVTIQATQAGQSAPTAYDYNMLRQSFTVTGTATLAITGQPASQSAAIGSTANLSVIASGTSALSYQWRKAGANITGNASANTATLALPNVQTGDTSSYDVVVTNASGSIVSDPVTLTVTTAAPVITNSPLTVGATVGSPFSFTIAASGATGYTASPLPAGLNIVGATGVISGTPTTVGITSVLLGATDGSGTGNATLTITVAPAGSAPVITNNPLTAAGTTGSSFAYTITASGSPTSYSASPLPAGLSISSATGAITGTPASSGTTQVLLGATNATGTGNATLTITIASPGVAPFITNNPLTAAGTTGVPFSYTITASGTPTSYAASNLPLGLILNTTTGAITGTPLGQGVTSVPLQAINAIGTGSATLSITIAAATIPPIITSPTSVPATVNVPLTYLSSATGLPTSYSATGLPAGLTVNALTGTINGTPTAAGTFTVLLTAMNAAGSNTAVLTFTVAPPRVAPVITSSATSPGTVGTAFDTYLIAATGLPTSYSATGLPSGLTLNAVTGAINGTPVTAGVSIVTLTASNSTGISTATLTITVDAAPFSRIVDFSARAISGPGDQTLIMGFVVSGDSKNLLVRGIGPGLASFGITTPLMDPVLTLFGPSGVTIAGNDDWQTPGSGEASGTLIAATAARVGAFPLANGSKDSALIAVFNDGAHTTSMTRPNSGTGVALTEIYDIDTTTVSRLVNVSARMNVAPGEGTLIAGVVIAGNTPKTVLIRGVGPTLSAFAVTGVLADPQLAVFSGRTEIARNDNWETGTTGVAQLEATSLRVGAFALNAGSKDAALVITLQPGSYTVHLTGVSNTTGIALVEVYDVQ